MVHQKDIEYGYGKAQGKIGTYHYERGLMWIATDQAGHMQVSFDHGDEDVGRMLSFCSAAIPTKR